MTGYSICALDILDSVSVKKDAILSTKDEEILSKQYEDLAYAMERINGYMILYSVTDRGSFNSVSKFVDIIRKIRSDLEPELIPILIVATKDGQTKDISSEKKNNTKGHNNKDKKKKLKTKNRKMIQWKWKKLKIQKFVKMER